MVDCINEPICTLFKQAKIFIETQNKKEKEREKLEKKMQKKMKEGNKHY